MDGENFDGDGVDEPAWAPANDVERELLAALERDDGPAFARLLESTRLLLPVLPDPDSPQAARLAEVFPPGAPYIPVFTSPESLVWAFDDSVEEYEELEFGALLQRWPSPGYLLAVNPGSPIAVRLPPAAITDLAEGRQSLLAVDDLQDAVVEEARTELRRLCLRELSGNDEVDVALRPDPPAGPLESALHEAVGAGDGQAYLHALLNNGPVLLLTSSPVTDPEAVFEDGFPWRVLGGDQAQIIAAFSSRPMLDRTGAPPGTASVEIDFLHVLANWPGEEFLLCVDPGSVLELMLSGDAVLDVVAAMAEALEPADPSQPG